METGKVVDGEVGVRLDPEAAAFALEAAVPGETVQLPAEVVYPEMTAQELECRRCSGGQSPPPAPGRCGAGSPGQRR